MNVVTSDASFVEFVEKLVCFSEILDTVNGFDDNLHQREFVHFEFGSGNKMLIQFQVGCIFEAIILNNIE